MVTWSKYKERRMCRKSPDNAGPAHANKSTANPCPSPNADPHHHAPSLPPPGPPCPTVDPSEEAGATHPMRLHMKGLLGTGEHQDPHKEQTPPPHQRTQQPRRQGHARLCLPSKCGGQTNGSRPGVAGSAAVLLYPFLAATAYSHPPSRLLQALNSMQSW